MICPSCSTHNQDDFKFCRECGQRLVAAAARVATVASAATTAVGDGDSPAARSDERLQAARLLDQAFELYDAGRYDDALGASQAVLALDPGATTAHSLLGMIYERLGRASEAVQQYQMALRMNPDSTADAAKLDSLLGRRDGVRGWMRVPLALRGLGSSRLPLLAGTAAGVAALIIGLWVTARAVEQGTANARRVASRPTATPVPGASLPGPPAPTMGMPGSEEALAPPRRGAPLPGASQWPSGAWGPGAGRQTAAVPAPPAGRGWPGLRGGFPVSSLAAHPPQAVATGERSMRGGRSGRTQSPGQTAPGYLAPASIHGVERIRPGATDGMAAMPGASLPSFPGASAAPRAGHRPGRGVAPVLPDVSDSGDAPAGPTSPAAPESPPATPVAPSAPPSASISIQPLEEPEPAQATRAARPTSAPPTGGPGLAEALQHQQMAAYYRRQGDHQAAYEEYQYARDLFRVIQQRGGRDAAVAASGAAAAQYGMSRLQGQ